MVNTNPAQGFDLYHTSFPFNLPSSGYANSVNNYAINVGSAAGTAGMWLVGIYLHIGSGGYRPPGRYYGKIIAPGNLVLWAGYLGEAQVASIPNLFVSPGDTFGVTVFTGSNAEASFLMDLDCTFSSHEPVGGAFLFDQPPFTGPGERFSLIQTPAAGTDFSMTVPAQVRRRIIDIYGVLTTSTVVASRQPGPYTKDASGNAINVLAPGWFGTIAASSSGGYSINQRGITQGYAGLADIESVAGLDGEALPAGFQWLANTANFQATDQWTTANMFIEEWAGPQP